MEEAISPIRDYLLEAGITTVVIIAVLLFIFRGVIKVLVKRIVMAAVLGVGIYALMALVVCPRFGVPMEWAAIVAGLFALYGAVFGKLPFAGKKA